MQERRIPTLLGFGLIMLGIAATVMGVQQYSNFRSKASASTEPKDIAISNVSDRSFSVTWITDAPAVGFLTYGPTAELGINAEDDRRDSEQYTTHQITVQGVEAGTKYYFKIGSGAKLYDQSGSAYEVTTAAANDPNKRDIISGFILKQQSEAAVDALVTITIKDSVPLTTLTNRDGQYRIDLAQARDKESFNQISYNPGTDFIDIKVSLPPDGEATATTTTANSHPVPPITLGAVNDFTHTEQPKPSSPPVTVTKAPTNSSSLTPAPGQTSSGISPLLNNPGSSSTTVGDYEKSRSALLGGGSSNPSPTSPPASYTNPPGSLIDKKSLDALGL